MALLQQEAIRVAESLDDYDHVTVRDIGGDGPARFQRRGSCGCDIEYGIASHCDTGTSSAPLREHKQRTSFRVRDVACCQSIAALQALSWRLRGLEPRDSQSNWARTRVHIERHVRRDEAERGTRPNFGASPSQSLHQG